MGDDTWAGLADQFADDAYASVKGRVRTYVMHQQLLEHLPAPPAPVLDVGGGAGHQSLPLAEAGYDVTLLDPSTAMLDKAHQRLQRLPDEARRRVTLLEADGENADEAVHGQRFAAVLCHGVIGYQENPEPMVDQLCRCAADGGIVSIMAGHAKAMAVRPAMERRWDDALTSFDARSEIGVLGVPTWAHTVDEISELLRARGVEPQRWYGVWLFVDWLDFSGAELDPNDSEQVKATAAVELEASRRDPYRQLSRVFHLVGRKGPDPGGSSNARTVESYELIADDYARETAGSGVLAGGLTRLAETVPGGHVLEIGSGPGWDADAIEEAGMTVRRTDITQAFIEGQRARGKQAEHLDVINDDLGGPYDAVVALHVLQHVEPDDLPTVLAKVAGALRPTGRFLVSIPLGEGAGWEVGESGRHYFRALWTEAEFTAALARVGLETEWTERAVEDEETGWLCVLAQLR